MASQTWVTLINAYEYSGTVAGKAYVSSKNQTAISPGGVEKGGAATVPANFLKPGTILRFTASGEFSCTEAAVALTLGIYSVKPGEAVTTGVEWAKSLLKTNGKKHTKQPWRFEATSRIVEPASLAAAGEGLAVTQGVIHGIVGENAAETTLWNPSPFPTGELSEGGKSGKILPGEEKLIVLSMKMGTSNAENAIQCYQWLVEALC